MAQHRHASLATAAWRRALCGCVCVAFFSAGANPASAQDTKTLTRLHDPVIVKTALLMGLPAKDTLGYRLYSIQHGQLSPIPFQFDERNSADDIVFSNAGGSGGFRFDENDELVFMAKDTGDRMTAGLLPATHDTAVEIEVADAVDGGRGWAYLLHFSEHIPALAPAVYATFDAETNQARALYYTVDYYHGGNFSTGLRIASVAGGTGENILDRMKLRMHPTFSVLLTTWSPLFTEEDFSVRVDGIRNGPVRAIRRVRQWLNLGQFFPDMPGGTAYTYYYFSSFMTPSTFSAPWLVVKALRSFEFTTENEIHGSTIEMTYRDAVNPRNLTFSGKKNGTEVVTSKDHEWYVVSGKQGTYLQAFVIPEQWKDWGIVRGTVIRSEPPATGYSLLNMTNLHEPGNYKMNLISVILPRPYQTGDEAQSLAMLQRPLQVAVKTVRIPAMEK